MVRHAAAVAAALSAFACSGGDRVVLPQSEELMLSLVIAPDDAAPSRVSLHAFLLRADNPLRSRYIVATRFEMRRARDSALFDWRAVTPPDTAVGRGGQFVLYSEGNYELPSVGSAPRLGRQDIRSGETYTLVVETEGRIVTGSVTVPGVPTIVRNMDMFSHDSVAWAASGGASGYSIVTQDFFPLSDFTTDTLYHFDTRNDNRSTKGTVVRAYEHQLFSYLTDRRLGRSGLIGALGVFGAYNSDSLPARWAGDFAGYKTIRATAKPDRRR